MNREKILMSQKQLQMVRVMGLVDERKITLGKAGGCGVRSLILRFSKGKRGQSRNLGKSFQSQISFCSSNAASGSF